jgi:uncharacterized membrane protein YgaE (UPF0421/DUF939 family)
MSDQTKAMLKSWFNVFISALITAVLVILTSNNGTIPMDGELWLGALISAVVAVLPVIKNYFDTSDHRYGKGAAGE